LHFICDRGVLAASILPFASERRATDNDTHPPRQIAPLLGSRGLGPGTGASIRATLRNVASRLTNRRPMKQLPPITVVMPVFNASESVGACLDALRASSHRPDEIIAVDDASTDSSVQLCEERGARIVRMDARKGPAAARNVGLECARTELVLFVDSDVCVAPDTVERAADAFRRRPEIAAVFGSYDSAPAKRNFFSQYKNLYHHYVHQQGDSASSTFWAGCGAVRRAAFVEVGGFDATRYSRPSIEDIELGYRLRAAGHSIVLDKGMQVKHLKEWTLKSWLRTDIFSRAVPWSFLILDRRAISNDLNIRRGERLRALLAGLLLVTIALAVLVPWLWYVAAALAAVNLIANLALIRFFAKQRGPIFAACSILAHFTYYIYSTAAFAVCWCAWMFSRRGASGSGSVAVDPASQR
jgi:GT2 family glycosyltransferase